METSDAERLLALFAAATELDPGARAAFLDRECAGDTALRAELDSLLEADAAFNATTARPVGAGLTGLIAQASPETATLRGLRVGPYVLANEIGRGGMGTVYRAERVDGAVQQTVAIKFVRRELLDATTLERFRRERQVMASLADPCIARLFDAAQLDDGTPYYVMEYVDGKPITAYCEHAGLAPRDRVALVAKVCDGVAAAHRGLIVHRDLKPSNILIDAQGAPRLLDFGIAKAIGEPGSPRDATGTAERYFSPQYAAPEQIAGAPIGVACDIYALGLLLYELLAGRKPFELTGLGAAQVERLVLHVPPEPPSAVATGVAARQLRGDLDAIVLRCLRKAPADRYASVDALRADLDAYCNGRPIEARGGERWYRARKFVRRNALAVAATAAVALSLVGGAGAFAWQARIAQARAAELERVSKFQESMLAQVDKVLAGEKLRTSVRAKYEQALVKAGVADAERETRVAAFSGAWQQVNATDAASELMDASILKPAAAAIARDFADQPLLEARLDATLGARYVDWGLYAPAAPLLDRALELDRRELGDEHPATLVALHERGELARLLGDRGEAVAIERKALDAQRRVLGADHRDTLRTALDLDVALRQAEKFDDSVALARETLATARRRFGEDDELTLLAMNELGLSVRDGGGTEEPERLFRDLLERRRRLSGPNDRLTIDVMECLASTLITERKFDEAASLTSELLVNRRKLFGEKHPETINAINHLATLLGESGKLDEALPYAREAAALGDEVFGRFHPDAILYANNIGNLLGSMNRTDEAEPYLVDAYERRRAVFGEEAPATLRTRTAVAELRMMQKRYDECVALLAPIEDIVRWTFTGSNAFYYGKTELNLGRCRTLLRRYAEAEPNLIEANRVFTQTPNTHPLDLGDSLFALAKLYFLWEQAQPGKGHDAKSLAWAHELDELGKREPMVASDFAGHDPRKVKS